MVYSTYMCYITSNLLFLPSSWKIYVCPFIKLYVTGARSASWAQCVTTCSFRWNRCVRYCHLPRNYTKTTDHSRDRWPSIRGCSVASPEYFECSCPDPTFRWCPVCRRSNIAENIKYITNVADDFRSDNLTPWLTLTKNEHAGSSLNTTVAIESILLMFMLKFTATGSYRRNIACI